MYPIRLTKLIGSEGYTSTIKVTSFPGGSANISDYYYLAPGEEKIFASLGFGAIACPTGYNCFVSFYPPGVVGDGTLT